MKREEKALAVRETTALDFWHDVHFNLWGDLFVFSLMTYYPTHYFIAWLIQYSGWAWLGIFQAPLMVLVFGLIKMYQHRHRKALKGA